MAKRRGRIQGLAEMRARVRAIPRTATQDFSRVLHESGAKLRDAMRARARAQMKEKTGRTLAGITYEVSGDRGVASRMRLLVGPIGVVPGRNDLFYARIQDLGRKAQTVTVRRGRGGFAAKLATGKGKLIKYDGYSKIYDTYNLNVPYMAPKRFVTGRYTTTRYQMNTDLAQAYRQLLAEAFGATP